jgi:hypothetical protein
MLVVTNSRGKDSNLHKPTAALQPAMMGVWMRQILRCNLSLLIQQTARYMRAVCFMPANEKDVHVINYDYLSQSTIKYI